MTISTRTPEGESNRCPICGCEVRIEPSTPAGDAPCPRCGTLLWFLETTRGIRIHPSNRIVAIAGRLRETIASVLQVETSRITDEWSFGDDSLDTVELVVELEEEFDIQIPDAEAQKIRTVADALDYIARFHNLGPGSRESN